jgi:ABC-2 type transport system ATP-binding protein
MDETAVKVDNLSKVFKLPLEKHSSVKSAIVNISKSQKGFELQRALSDVSFEVQKGDFFGIVGRNGSGKSTLLKLIAGIYTPTQGSVQVNGSLTPFIELGVGFNPELTGRENVYLNGSLLGFNRKEMTAMYKDIVEFAELEKFMDQKLKNYSSGMQVRLAFSIAIRAQSDILVLDEVLAVGDAAFQRKCINVFENYKAQKKTIILVTHDMSVVERFCNRAILINDGKLVKSGDPRAVAELYNEMNKNKYSDMKLSLESKRENEELKIGILDYKTKRPKKRFVFGDTALIHLKWKRKDVRYIGVAILKQSGEYAFGPNTYQENQPLKAGATSDYYAVKLNLGAGDYYLKAGLFGEDDSASLEFVDEGPGFMVEMPKGDKAIWGGITYLPHAWGDKNVKL